MHSQPKPTKKKSTSAPIKPMAAKLSLSNPLNLFTAKGHKPNLHPNNVVILNHSFSGKKSQMLRRGLRMGDDLVMSLIGQGPEIVALKGPITARNVFRKKRSPAWRSLTLESLRGGTSSLEVLLDAKKARLDPQFLDNAEHEFRRILSQRRIEFHELKEAAWKMEMSRKEDAAVRMLSEALERFIKEGKGSLEIYEVKLLLVEMLIYQGDFKKARETCTALQKEYKVTKDRTFPPELYPGPRSVPVEHVGPTDIKLQLYQAVICVLLGPSDEAKTHWAEFNAMSRKGFGGHGSSKAPIVDQDDDDDEDGLLGEEDGDERSDHHGLTFDQFEEHIRVLQQEIAAARK